MRGVREPHTFALQGGLDLVTPPIAFVPGRAIGARNYEPEVRGYRRMQGYERYDGQPEPSKASYWIVQFTGSDLEVTAGDQVDGPSGSGIAVVDGVLESGSYAGSDAAGYLVLAEVTGSFAISDALEVSAVSVGTAASTDLELGAGSDALSSTYLQAAIERRRTLIAEIPGSGPVRGVAALNGSVYAWRDNAGATAGIMHKATSAGWVAQTFGEVLYFDAGTAEFVVGETLTGGTSTETATIERVIKQSGAWTGDAAGYLILSGASGTFTNNETITSASGSATANGASSTIALPAGGTYRAITHNFTGISGQLRLYVANGVGFAFEWDGSVLAPIDTGAGAAVDKPTHVAEYSEHLFLGYAGGNVQNSGTGLPLSFEVLDGAGAHALGQDVTDMARTSDSLIVVGLTACSYFVGNDITNFVLRPISEESGGQPGTFQIMGDPIFMDNIGLRNLRTVQAYGNWRVGTLTELVEPYMKAKRTAGLTPVASQRVRGKAQYRLFYDDMSGFFVYFGRKVPEVLPFDLSFQVNVASSVEDASGTEMLFAGDADSGMVYQMDSGTSFDGASVDAFLQLGFVNQGTPRQEKRYHNAFIDCEAIGQMTIGIGCEFSYGDPDLLPTPEQDSLIEGTGGFWDVANWDQFQWGVPIQNQLHVDINGKGLNISLAFVSDHTYERPHTISTATINYSQRRKLR